MSSKEDIKAHLSPAPAGGLPAFLADPFGHSHVDHLRYAVDVAKKLIAKSPERTVDATLVVMYVLEDGKYRDMGYDTVKEFLKAEGLGKSTAYTTIKAVRRFGAAKVIDLGTTNARALARLEDADKIIAEGFDYLSEDGTVRHIKVDDSTTREFQKALKRRVFGPVAQAADSMRQARAALPIADAAGESEPESTAAEKASDVGARPADDGNVQEPETTASAPHPDEVLMAPATLPLDTSGTEGSLPARETAEIAADADYPSDTAARSESAGASDQAPDPGESDGPDSGAHQLATEGDAGPAADEAKAATTGMSTPALTRTELKKMRKDMAAAETAARGAGTDPRAGAQAG